MGRPADLYSAVRIVTVLHSFRIEGRQRFRKPFNDVDDFVHLHLIHSELASPAAQVDQLLVAGSVPRTGCLR